MKLSILQHDKKLFFITKFFTIFTVFSIIYGSDIILAMQENLDNDDKKITLRQSKNISLEQLETSSTNITFSVNSAPNNEDVNALLLPEGQAVVKWLDENMFVKFNSQLPPTNKCFDRSLFVVEAVSGGARGIIFFVLGYEFAERFLHTTAISKTGQIVLSSLYGLTDYIPMAFLGTELSSSVVKKLFYKKSNSEKLIERDISWKNYLLEYSLKTPVAAAGLLSAPPMTYLTYDDLSPYVGWGWLVPGIPTFYVRTLIDYYSITTLAGNIYDYIKSPIDRRFARVNPHSRQAYTTSIKDTLQEARLYISSLNYSQAETLTQALKERLDPLERFKVFSQPESFITEKVQVKRDSLLKTVIGIAGGIVGGYGQWVMYPVAKDSFVPILTLVGLQDNEALITGLAITGTATASGLTTLATWSSTLKFYDAMSGLCSSAYNRFSTWLNPRVERTPSITANTVRENSFFWKRLGASTVSGVLAICGAGPQAQIALTFLNINEIWPKLELASAIIAVCSTSFWAVDEVLLKLLKAGDPRQPLLNTIDQIILKLPDMSKKSLRELSSLLPRKAFGESTSLLSEEINY